MVCALAWETSVDPMCDWSIQVVVHHVYSMLCELQWFVCVSVLSRQVDVQNLVCRSANKIRNIENH